MTESFLFWFYIPFLWFGPEALQHSNLFSVVTPAAPAAALYCDVGSFAAVTTRSVSFCRDNSGAAIRPGARFIQIKTKCFSGTKQDE